MFLILWGSVLIGRQSLVPEDILYVFPPFASLAGAHHPVQTLTGDLALEFFPWFRQVQGSLLAGHLPLWNPFAFGGSPLLANGQSAPFSPFTVLAVPFDAAYGMSLMMLARLVVAGAGTYLFLRQLGAGSRASMVGGVAFAASSYMVVWLGWPHSAVAALVPWGFAAAERYQRGGSRRALACLALIIGLQFLAGHIETSIQFTGALAVYSLARVVFKRRGRAGLVSGLVVAGIVGILLSAAALVPFLYELQSSGIAGRRLGFQFGLAHLQPVMLLNWLIPNRLGNPGIDGLYGPFPNYNESSGFATLTALMLAPLGMYWLWKRTRGAAVALVSIGLVAAGTVYGLLTPIIGRLPILSLTPNNRMTVVICFVVAVLGGLGVQQLEDRQRERPGMIGAVLATFGAAAVAGLVVMAYLLFNRRAAVDTMFPNFHYIGFWVIVAGLTLAGAGALILAGSWRGASRAAVAGVAAMVVVEAAIFAGPYNPKINTADIAPASSAMTQLRQLAGDRPVVGIRGASLPESLSLYQLHDAAGYDPIFPPRVSLYWSHSDPQYYVADAFHVVLGSPRVDMLAAAGVAYVETPEQAPLAGTRAVSRVEGVVLQEVPNARPFAYAVSDVVTVRGPDEAIRTLAAHPERVVVEGCCSIPCKCGSSTAAGAPWAPPVPYVTALSVRREANGGVVGDVNLVRSSLVVLDQTFSPGWVARVDGHQVPVHPANVMLQSVEVPAGSHHLELSYEPASVSIGLALSGLGLLGLVAILFLPLQAWWSRWASR
jgi:Bacterial membrane protein YfhO